jgi:nitroimidazol reductase NimA-like FMN-containing flavoprotein (pyridoxamine 5'-phosphate oxidase superfamily)
VTERKKVNMHLLEAYKSIHVRGRVRKATERKICNTHLLEAWEAIFKYEKKGEKGREGEESDGKKDGQYAFIK